MSKPLAVITGASAGIGAVFARKLAARGYDLLLIARREDRLRSLAEELGGDYLVGDLAQDEDLDRAVERVKAAQHLGLLVNNAGFGSLGNFHETDPADQEQMHRLHVIATLRLTQAALSNLVPRAQAGTGVISVSSVAAFMRAPQNVSYCATKTWINAFTEGIAIELGGLQSPVRVQALCPGFTLSEFHDVLKMDRSPIPRSLWMSADFVVEESLRGFERGKLFVIPGWRYKLVVAGMRTIPDVLLRKLAVRGTQKYRTKQS
ncbi:MAG TPA: SDR family oxidoreductase [Bryobacteraceae bacterium]|nr:SDR family oxidoreductase [Bryobacteraceae bacterium]